MEQLHHLRGRADMPRSQMIATQQKQRHLPSGFATYPRHRRLARHGACPPRRQALGCVKCFGCGICDDEDSGAVLHSAHKNEAFSDIHTHAKTHMRIYKRILAKQADTDDLLNSSDQAKVLEKVFQIQRNYGFSKKEMSCCGKSAWESCGCMHLLCDLCAMTTTQQSWHIITQQLSMSESFGVGLKYLAVGKVLELAQ